MREGYVLGHIVNTEFANNEISNFRNHKVWFLDTRTFLLMLLTSNDVSNTIFKDHIENCQLRVAKVHTTSNVIIVEYNTPITL